MPEFSYGDNRYRAEVVRWVDGDTVILRVDLGQDTWVKPAKGYRVARIDAPETARRKGVTAEEKERGLELKATLKMLYPVGTVVWIATSKGGKFDRYVAERIPLGRGQTPEDIGNAATFLASDLASNITGQALNVSGGSHMN